MTFKKGMKVRMTKVGLSLGMGISNGVVTGFPGRRSKFLMIRRPNDKASYAWAMSCWEPVNPKRK